MYNLAGEIKHRSFLFKCIVKISILVWYGHCYDWAVN